MQRRGGIVLVAALLLFGGACSSGDESELEAFDLTGRVVSVEPAAQPADAPTDVNITGAIVVQTAEPAECETDADGVRVYVEQNTDFTPSSAATDLEKLEGKTVTVNGGVSKDGDTCTVIADSVATQGASAEPTDGDEADNGGGGANTGGGATPSSTDDGDAPTSSPNDPDDEGSISDTDETASPAPKDPDKEGVIDPDGN